MPTGTANRVIGTAASSDRTAGVKRSPEHSFSMIRATAGNDDISLTIARSGFVRAVWAPALTPWDAPVRGDTAFEVVGTSRLTVGPSCRPCVPHEWPPTRDQFCLTDVMTRERVPRHPEFLRILLAYTYIRSGQAVKRPQSSHMGRNRPTTSGSTHTISHTRKRSKSTKAGQKGPGRSRGGKRKAARGLRAPQGREPRHFPRHGTQIGLLRPLTASHAVCRHRWN